MSLPRLLLLLALLLGGAAAYFLLVRYQPGQVTAPLASITLHAADTQGLFLVPYRQAGPFPATPEAWAQEVFEHLQRKVPSPYVSVVPAHARLNAAEYAPPHWRLVVSLQGNLGSNGERLMVAALVKTFLAGWPAAKDVHLSFRDNKQNPLIGLHIDLSAPLTSSDVANQLVNAPATGLVKATLWWPARDTRDLVPVQVGLEGATGVPPRDALARLLEGPGPESEKFLAKLAIGTDALQWISLKGNTAELQWLGSVPIPSERGNDLRAVVLSLTEFPEVRAVQFRYAGKPLAQHLGSWNLALPLSRSDCKTKP